MLYAPNKLEVTLKHSINGYDMLMCLPLDPVTLKGLYCIEYSSSLS